MTHRLAGILSDYLSREQMIEKDEADIYQYGLEIFMDGVLETLLLVVLGMVESAAKEVDAGVIEAAQSMGASTFRIIWKVIIPEAKPALITGAVISTVTILGYSAMAGTIGGGGLGQIAITYGYQKYDDQIVWLCVALTIIIVQILQEFGMYIARRTDRRART